LTLMGRAAGAAVVKIVLIAPALPMAASRLRGSLSALVLLTVARARAGVGHLGAPLVAGPAEKFGDLGLHPPPE
jgi:hypothetical protein